MNPRVKQIENIFPYKMILLFTNGETKEFDFSYFLHYPVFEPLQNKHFFTNAVVWNGTIVWNDEIDFDPDTLFLESKTVSLV